MRVRVLKEELKEYITEVLGEDSAEEIEIGPVMGMITISDIKQKLEENKFKKISPDDELLLELQGQVRVLKMSLKDLTNRVQALEGVKDGE